MRGILPRGLSLSRHRRQWLLGTRPKSPMLFDRSIFHTNRKCLQRVALQLGTIYALSFTSRDQQKIGTVFHIEMEIEHLLVIRNRGLMRNVQSSSDWGICIISGELL